MKKKINQKQELPTNPYADYIALQEKARLKRIQLEKQATIDFQKWLDSERKKTDMSGAEPWCMFCKNRTKKLSCSCDPTVRSAEAVCVKAYYEFQKRLNGEK